MNEFTVEELAPLSYGKGLPEAKRISGSIPVYGSNGIIGYHNEAFTYGPTVVIGRKGTVGVVHLSKIPCWPIDTTFFIDFENLDEARFMYYALKSAGLEKMNSDSAVPGLNRDAAHARTLWLPNEDSWEAIAGVLGALDDKIDHNRHTAQTLEQLARAVYRAWFVDFEPMKAKAAGAGSFPSMPQHVFDALPTNFVDSAIGPVPEGWEVENIGDVVTVKGGSTPSTKEPDYWDGGEHRWATPKDLSRLSHPVLLDTERHITNAGVDQISSGLLPVGTVLMSSRAPIGYLAISRVPTAVNQGFIAMICDGPLPPAFILNWARSSMETIRARAGGTTFPEISKKNFRPIPIMKPPDEVVAAYGQAVDPLFGLLTACVKENDCLAETRDYILPHLLSGQVTVEAADG
ncbi:MAG: restriction endonuclease subunit S [Caldilineaceae bacterium SB0675_bin_29]|uniref:Restriction endonuclease subunit S n=1 Tax=Caldilineaceae bacterium SB0675_bin_29 TaxID=2605266 RepID=A0A6B1FZM2_9CHLR|nr:restriction endonuclease subunit S [Caldilineaceae bacterium SB0675_bin_29]